MSGLEECWAIERISEVAPRSRGHGLGEEVHRGGGTVDDDAAGGCECGDAFGRGEGRAGVGVQPDQQQIGRGRTAVDLEIRRGVVEHLHLQPMRLGGQRQHVAQDLGLLLDNGNVERVFAVSRGLCPYSI